MRKNQKNQNIIIAIMGIIIVALLVVIMILIKPDSAGNGENTQTETETNQVPGSESELDTESETDTQTGNTTESETESESESQNGNNNTQTGNGSFDGYATDVINWGTGGDKNELGQPYDCLKATEKYKDLGGYFVMPIQEKIIYLTFDEGYENGYTPAILDTLKEKNVKAVFFCTNQFFRDNEDLVWRIINEGHVLASHSKSHPAAGMPSLGIQGQIDDIMWLHNHVKDKYNYEMTLFRYPSGKFNEQSLAVMKSLGYNSIFWSFAHYDYDVNDQPDPAKSLQKFIDKMHPGAIYLVHAVSSTNTEILGDFIDQARAAGYEFGLIEN